MEKRSRRKTRCKICGKRIWLKIDIDEKEKRFRCLCPNCGNFGNLRLVRYKKPIPQ